MFKKILFGCLLFCGVVLAANPDTTISQRIHEDETVVAQAPPYTYAVAVDVSSADQTFDGIVVCELRCKTAGTIKVDLPTATGVSIYAGAYDIFRIRVTKVYKTGTDAGLQSGDIVVFGFKD
jgi:hypothetical protein